MVVSFIFCLHHGQELHIKPENDSGLVDSIQTDLSVESCLESRKFTKGHGRSVIVFIVHEGTIIYENEEGFLLYSQLGSHLCFAFLWLRTSSL